ncbi:hypothetical protein NE237_016756 [Protea cynaroides]|uniref:Uncharacterized protein n=1 Tax=Protea cynaroides TaxID=273540 RepID=A0A9Q0K6K6_9MAGN|nr:hypothetical protein NE237_016756 [Protea cynaroides]
MMIYFEFYRGVWLDDLKTKASSMKDGGLSLRAAIMCKKNAEATQTSLCTGALLFLTELNHTTLWFCEIQLPLAKYRLSESGVPEKWGLVIGKLICGLDRGLVYDLLPPPPNNAGESACRFSESGSYDEGSHGKSQTKSPSLVIDIDWVAEYALQVLKYHCKELMSMEDLTHTPTILEPETEAI